MDNHDKFPRGSLPPTVFTPHEPGKPAPEPGTAPRASCDLASTCPNCNTVMQPEHAHYRCLTCGYRDSCCF